MADSSRPIVYSRSLQDADIQFWTAWPAICDDYRALYPDHWLMITCTYRAQQVQDALWLQGRASLRMVNEMRFRVQLAPILEAENRVVTFAKQSKHTVSPSLALDFVVTFDPDGPAGPIKAHLDWDDTAYHPMIELAHRHGLLSGGTFKRPDWCHLEVPS